MKGPVGPEYEDVRCGPTGAQITMGGTGPSVFKDQIERFRKQCDQCRWSADEKYAGNGLLYPACHHPKILAAHYETFIHVPRLFEHLCGIEAKLFEAKTTKDVWLQKIKDLLPKKEMW